MLTVNGIRAIYGGVVLGLSDVSLKLEEGKVVALLGANGSGKSTTLKSISGMLRTEDGKLSEGSIELDGKRIDRLAPERIARLGVCHVLQGISVFPQLSTEENLLMGAYLRQDRKNVDQDMDGVYRYFPNLPALRRRKAGYLSGGEQQMLVIGRALLTRPRFMLLDEPSLGLAPGIIGEIFSILKTICRESNTSLLVAEQNTAAVLEIADYGYVLQNGRTAYEGKSGQLEGDRVKKFYLGLGESGTFISYHDKA
ncbi:MAG: ABC transporter ATP-binding protein [Chloroflexi bacterium]|nr:ABC transporter ATP-binding protein [Chloroflexota bacterium]